MVGSADLDFKGFGRGGGPIDDASSGLIALLPSSSALEASDLVEGIGSAMGLVEETGGELWDWVGGNNFAGTL